MVLARMETLSRICKNEQGNGVASELEGEGICGAGWVMELGAHDAELAGVAQQLLSQSQQLAEASSSSTLAEASRREAAVWDAYALGRFHGRLLPGCSHLGCTNTSGVSEACLDTRLCSGCRRARYCSVACQRAAWVEGGHSDVCGRGGWVGVTCESLCLRE